VLDNQQQNLENQLVEVSSIGNLHAAARRLGLVEAENPALFTLPDGKIIGVLTPAKGKPAVTAQDSKATADAGAGTVVPANGQQTGQGTGTGANSGTTGLEGAANGAAGTTGTTGTSGATGTTGTTGTNGTANNGMTADGSQMSGTTSGTTGAGQ
jgi:hypothetical protein